MNYKKYIMNTNQMNATNHDECTEDGADDLTEEGNFSNRLVGFRIQCFMRPITGM
jgi:hypothetical protein